MSPLPELQTTNDEIVFVVAPFGPNSGRLVIRCEENGNVWIAIRPDSAGDAA